MMKLLLTCLGVVLCFASPLQSYAADRESPNVLFIAVDDLRCDLGSYGAKHVRSPHIDRLASSGVAFTRAYVQVAVCNPSRVSVMTGLRPDTTKVWDLATEFRTTAPNVVTIPQHFRAHGYYAVSFGKVFHNPWPDNVSWSEPHSWPKGAQLWSREARQRRKAFQDRMRADGKSPAKVDRVRAVATEVVEIPDSKHIDGAIADQAIEAMSRLAKRDEPFFLAVGFVRPHLPFVVPRKYWALYDRQKLPLASNQYLPKDMPAVAFGDRSRGGLYELADYMDYVDVPSPFDGSLSEAQQRELRHGYYASVSLIDAQVGRVLAELDRLKLSDNTVVVLWSDHGWKLGEHNGWCKQTNFEIDTRAPLIIRQPGAAANGKPCDAIVEFVDIYPTLCELAGLPIPAALEGKSVAPLLKGKSAPQNGVAFSQFERRHRQKRYMGYAMRTDRYRYIEWLDRTTTTVAFRELYDHQSDPDENVNIADASKHASLLESLSARMWKALPRPKAAVSTQAAAPKRPNILFLMADDWSSPHAGVLGDPIVKTPTIDRMARQGVLFQNAFVSSPSCTPSRLSIATGQWHWRLGEGANLGGSLREGVPVYPEMLAKVGYKIGFSRKGAGPSDYKYTHRDPFGPRFKNFETFIKERKSGEPFCYWYGAGEPHRPYRFGESKKSRIDPSKVVLPSCLPDHEIVRRDFADYLHRVQRFDADCGKMLDMLAEAGELENTIVVISGDNGLPFPRCKATLYDTGTHVPLIVRWGALGTRGRKIEDFVSLTDLAPTILEAAGIKPAEQMTGRSLLPILRSDKSGRVEPERDFMLFGMDRHVYPTPARALRTRDFLYIRNTDPARWPTGEPATPEPIMDFTKGDWPKHPGAFSYNIDPSPTKQYLLRHRNDVALKPFFALACGRRPAEELYDLRKDPAQMRNVAADAAYAKDVQRLSKQLKQALRDRAK